MQENNVSIQDQFERFHDENPRVFEELLQLARKLRGRGHRSYSMDALMHVVRFHRHIDTTDPDFKINNNYSSRYSRKMTNEHPEFVGFFHTRELKAE